jgi:hypothetical protein
MRLRQHPARSTQLLAFDAAGGMPGLVVEFSRRGD